MLNTLEWLEITATYDEQNLCHTKPANILLKKYRILTFKKISFSPGRYKIPRSNFRMKYSQMYNATNMDYKHGSSVIFRVT